MLKVVPTIGSVTAALISVAFISISAFSQPASLDLAPPPMKILAKEEKDRLDRTKDIGSRTKLSLELMEGRLKNAETQNAGENFEGMFRELGHFHALMDDSLDFLNRSNPTRGKVLDNFKRLEIGFRKFIPRLEAVRRELPIRYEDYVRKLMIRIREARSKATEPLFGDTVILKRDGDQ